MVEHRAAHIVELDSEGLVWVKSSYSGQGGGNCLELAVVADRVLVRCSRGRRKATLSFSRESWLMFLAGVPSDR